MSSNQGVVTKASVSPALFAKWQNDSTALFNKFRGQMVLCAEQGMDADAFITDEKGGYYIFFLPSPDVTHVVEGVGKVNNSIIASEVLVYPESVLHTTFTDYKVASRFNPSEAPDHKHVLAAFDEIASGIAELMKKRASPPSATYGELLFSMNTFMLEGFATDSSHLEGALYLQEKGKELLDSELWLPWGSHLSFGRVARRIEPAKVRELAKYCKSLTPLMGGQAYPFAAVQAGWYTVSAEKGFQTNVTSSFEL